MNSSIRTVLFAGLAVVSLGIAWATHSLNTPLDLAEFSDVGTEFSPDFKDPDQATGLQVASYNSKTGKTDVFKVESRDGLWRIPTHHDYPADGKDQLAKTAASMIGVTRKALVERSKSAHKRYGVLDPLDTTVTGTEGRGDRITLYKGNQKIVDLIVGKPLEGESGVYYVRQPDRDPVYTASLGQLDISARFADWIQADLLEVAQGDINKLFIDNYHLDEAAGRLVPEEQIDLTLGDNRDWQLADLDPTKEKLKTNEITSTLSALSSLKIVGVRKKPADLIAVLNGEGEGVVTSSLIDMQEKGFFVARGNILANKGNLELGTSKGVRYGLRFGEEFSGSDVDIEVGKSTKEDSADSKPEAAATKINDDSTENAVEKTDNLAKSRYVMITVIFDPKLLGPAPMAPTKPEPPKEAKPADDKADPAAAADATTADAAADAADATPEKDTAAPVDAKPEESPQEKYEDALKEYELAQEVYEIQTKQYEADVTSGKKRVDGLNRRFADWYYVISEADFERLRLKRAALVEVVEAPMAPETTTETPAKPATPPTAETTPAAKPAEEKKPVESKSAEQKPGEEKPATNTPASETPASEDKPAAEPAKEAKPAAEEAKPAAEAPAEKAPEPKSEEKTE